MRIDVDETEANRAAQVWAGIHHHDGEPVDYLDGVVFAILASDALCSFSDDTHDALMELYLTRFSEQLEVATTAEILAGWP